MKVGFLGTGAITSALVTGLCTAEQIVDSIYLSPRNKEKSELLKSLFPIVQVGQSNQDVVDYVDIIVLAFLPKDYKNILKELVFRDDQIIIHLLSCTKISQVSLYVNKKCPIIRAVPLPCAEKHIGPIAVFPAHEKVTYLFNALGTAIVVEKEEQLEYLSVITAFMAPYFEMLGCITDWAVEQGVKQTQASTYIASMFEALSVLAKEYPSGNLHQLANESMTPGGLNELALKTILHEGGYDYLTPALENVCSRVLGKSDIT